MRSLFTVFLLVAPVFCISACRTAERQPWQPPTYGAPTYVVPQQPSAIGQPMPSFPQGAVPPSFQQGTPPPSFQPTSPPPSFQPYQQQPPPGMQIPQQQQQVDYRWRAPDVKLYPPQVAAETKKEEPSRTTAEPPLLDKAPRTGLPVGIPQFASVNTKVSAGLKPSPQDGLDWLRAAGYRSVLHIRAPGEDNSADRKEVEKRGMTFVDLEVSAQTLSKETAESFNRLVADAAMQPIFVYDRDGSLAGSLWYLHFRMADLFADDAARLRARGLGLREDDGSHRLMWLAVQRILSELPK